MPSVPFPPIQHVDQKQQKKRVLNENKERSEGGGPRFFSALITNLGASKSICKCYGEKGRGTERGEIREIEREIERKRETKKEKERVSMRERYILRKKEKE